MKGLILAAGRGTRLLPLTDVCSKPMVPLAGRALIHHALDKLVAAGIIDIGIVVGDNEEELRGGIFRADAQLTFIRQPEPLGLAHAVSFAREFTGDDDFVMLLCDNVFESGLAGSFDEWRRVRSAGQCECLLHVRQVEDPRAYGVAVVENGVVTSLEEKPQQPRSNLAIAGIYFFARSIYEAIELVEPSQRGEMEITDAIAVLISRGHTVLAIELGGFWFDTGTVEDLRKAEAALLA
ncbi:MAG: sugar phosphate nucleotidyltransferase [bacterium]|nr:sugar phosphate nucleotidyltransferase [bacterium]